MSKLRNSWFLIVLYSIAAAVIVYHHFVLHKDFAGLWDVFSLLVWAFGLFLCGAVFIRRGRLVRSGCIHYFVVTQCLFVFMQNTPFPR